MESLLVMGEDVETCEDLSDMNFSTKVVGIFLVFLCVCVFGLFFFFSNSEK